MAPSVGRTNTTSNRADDGFGLAAHRGTDGARIWDREDDFVPKTVILGVETDDDAFR
ncbi:MAG: hypothetical protein ACQERM_01810 [Methanobacteriota archaeon]